MKKQYVLILTCFLFSLQAFSQASIWNNSANQVITGDELGQSFEATQNGLLTNIRVSPNTTNTSTLTIYSGDGYGGSVLHTQSVTFTDLFNNPASYTYQTIVISAPVSLTNGNMYTFRFSGNNSFGADDNSYVHGELHDQNEAFTDLDMPFIILQGVAPNTLTFVPANGIWNSAASWTPAQIPTSIDHAIIPNGKTVTLSTSNAEADDLTINSGGTLNITPTGALTLAGQLQNDATGTLVIDSDASNSGSIIVGSYTGTIAKYQRYLSGGGSNWHLISTPLSSGGITVADFITAHGGSMTQSGVKYSLGTYDNSEPADGVSTWKNFTSNGDNPAPASEFGEAKGYEILMSSNTKVDFTGVINNAPIAFSLTENTTGWNLIGNPFPSSVYGNVSANANNFLSQNSAQLDQSYVSMYIWNPNNGSYDIVNQATGSRSLAPGQAFFVKSKSGGGSVIFENNMRTHQTSNNFQKAASTGIPTITLSADNNSGSVNNTDIKYMSGATLDLDPGYDAGQFGATGKGNFNLYTRLTQDNGVNLGLQVVPDSDYEKTVIPVGINADSGTQLTFKATATDLPLGKKVFLEDKLLNSMTEINNTNKSYTVTLSSNLSGTGRFYLHTLSETLNIDDVSASQYTLVTSPEQNNIRLYGTVTEKGSVNIFDTFGRQIHSTTLQKGSEQNIKVPVMSTGVYIIKFNIDNKPFSKKIMWY